MTRTQYKLSSAHPRISHQVGNYSDISSAIKLTAMTNSPAQRAPLGTSAGPLDVRLCWSSAGGYRKQRGWRTVSVAETGWQR